MKIEVTDEYLYNIMPKVAELMVKKLQEEDSLLFEPSKRFQKNMKKLIRKSKFPRAYEFIERKAVKAASWIILVFAVGFAVVFSVQATEELRMKIKERIFYEDSVVERFDVDGIGQIKYLKYIPEGYELSSEEHIDNNYWALYENQNGESFGYSVWSIDDSTSITKDIEFEATKEIEMNGLNITIGYKASGATRTYWYDHNMFYIIDATCLTEEDICNMLEE